MEVCQGSPLFASRLEAPMIMLRPLYCEVLALAVLDNFSLNAAI